MARKRSHGKKALALLIGIALGLAIAEGIVRRTEVDLKFAKKILYYQGSDPGSYQVDENPWLLFRPRAGRVTDDQHQPPYTVEINSLDVRGPERSEKKPEGVFRILCFGGSNTFGAGVSNGQTWPAQLETALFEKTGLAVEVWNMGASAYVGVQMAQLAKLTVPRFDPDLVIISPTNSGPRAFLADTPVKPYFEKYPWLWLDLVLKPEIVAFPKFIPGSIKKWAAIHSHFYRYLVLVRMNQLKMAAGSFQNAEKQNIARVREFVRENKSAMKVCFFLIPFFPREIFDDYVTATGVPVFALSAHGKDETYKGIHPPPEVLKWYGIEIADWLIAKNLVPKRGQNGV